MEVAGEKQEWRRKAFARSDTVRIRGQVPLVPSFLPAFLLWAPVVGPLCTVERRGIVFRMHKLVTCGPPLVHSQFGLIPIA